MGLDVSVRLRRISTGEIVELSDFGGRYGFEFVKDYVKARNKVGWFTPTEEDRENLIFKGIEFLKKDGYTMHDFDDNCGVAGFVKLLGLADFYAMFGYEIQVEADW